MLATKLSPKFCTFTLPKIWLQDGSTTLYPQRTLQAFQTFYTTLYQKGNTKDGPSIESFLDYLNIPTLSKEHIDIMEAPISMEETLEVIKKL